MEPLFAMLVVPRGSRGATACSDEGATDRRGADAESERDRTDEDDTDSGVECSERGVEWRAWGEFRGGVLGERRGPSGEGMSNKSKSRGRARTAPAKSGCISGGGSKRLSSSTCRRFALCVPNDWDKTVEGARL